MRREHHRKPLFHRRRFADQDIILCVRWYLRFKLSYREMAEVAGSWVTLGAPSTILRWVVRYAEEVSRLWPRFERPLGRSWRCAETYIKVGGGWMYLYRAVDELGRTVASHLSRTRDKSAAKAFFGKLSNSTENLGRAGGELLRARLLPVTSSVEHQLLSQNRKGQGGQESGQIRY